MTCLLLTGARQNFSSGRVQVPRPEKPAAPPPKPAEPEKKPPVIAVPPVIPPPAPVIVPPAPPIPPVSQQPKIQEPAVPAVMPVPDIVLLEDGLPAGAVAEGTWVWDSANSSSGKQSHGHPPVPGLQSHGLSMEKPVLVTMKSMITQQVWLDPGNPPKGISLQLKLTTGEEVGVYWEGEEEVFKPQESQELWYYGPLPELGQWAVLEVLAEDLGLEEGQVVGLRFVTYGGRALWGKTVLTAAPPIEEPKDLASSVEVRPSLGGKPES